VARPHPQRSKIAFGFNMKTIGPASDKPIAPDAKGLHIYQLELLAVIINLWLALKAISTGYLCLSGYILDLLLDNTTVLFLDPRSSHYSRSGPPATHSFCISSSRPSSSLTNSCSAHSSSEARRTKKPALSADNQKLGSFLHEHTSFHSTPS
jgi:hypothetical protein